MKRKKDEEEKANGQVQEQIQMMVEFDDDHMFIVFGNQNEAIEFSFTEEEAAQMANDINEWLKEKREKEGEQNDEPTKNTTQ